MKSGKLPTLNPQKQSPAQSRGANGGRGVIGGWGLDRRLDNTDLAYSFQIQNSASAGAFRYPRRRPALRASPGPHRL